MADRAVAGLCSGAYWAAFGLGLVLAWVPPVQAAETPKARKVSVKDLEGFGKDINEIDLEKMLEEQQSKTGVASARPTTVDDAPGAVTIFKAEDIANLGARTLLELLRFAPGFFQPEAPGYWTYAFAWVVTDQRPVDPPTLAGELTAYFRGLTRAVAGDKKDLPALDLARIEARLSADGRGTAHTFDAFGDGRPVDLDLVVIVQPCGSGTAILVAAERRGHPPLSPTPTEVLRTFRCDSPVR